MLTRREWLAGAAVVVRPKGLLIDSHIHLFEPERFLYHPGATYRPPAQTLDSYRNFVREAAIDHTVIVHPEPYQDDHRYLEYCFANEPRKGCFKGTALFDPIGPDTPARLAALVKKHPGRIVALRIHENQGPGKPPTTSGAIRDRDLKHPAMKKTWRAAADLGIAIQMHFIPYYAPQIGALAAEFRDTPVILDHLARAGQGNAAEYDEVLRLARLPRVYMKFSGVRYSSKQDHPHADAAPLVRRTYEAFGPDRMIWGGLGHAMPEFHLAVELFERMFAFAPEADRAKIRGLSAKNLFGW